MNATRPVNAVDGATIVSRPRVLVVDDHEPVTRLIASWLADIGHVYTATTAAQALALTRAVRPDLAIVDIVLPLMDGFDLVARLRRHLELADMPVIFITGSDRYDVGLRARDVPGAIVLYKPLDEHALREAVRTSLQRGSSQ